MKTIQYQCPSCGAALEYSAAGQACRCKYCDSEFTGTQLAEIYPENEYHPLDIAENPDEERDDGQFAEYNALYSCPSCGAAVVTEATTSATRCFYCHTPVILTGRLSGEYRPVKIIPFKVEQERATALFREYCGKRWFLPRGFKEAALGELTAVYIPYWLGTCRVGGRIMAKCKKVRSWRSGDYQYTETQEFSAVRAGDMLFERIPADASKKADDILMECIEPFDYAGMTDFRMSYLTGYLAEKYDVAKDEAYPRVQSRANKSACDRMISTITGYSSVNIVNNTVDVQSMRWEHTLFPIWFLSYRHGERDHHFAVNGQTGKFAGSLPVSWGKLLLFCAAAVLVITGGFVAGGLLL